MTQEEVMGIIADALEVDRGQLNKESDTETLEAWDSLGQISILVALDTALDGRVAGIEGIQRAYSVAAIMDALRQNGLLD